MKEIFKNNNMPKAIVKGQSIIIINKDNIIAESYFGGMGITVTANGDLDIEYPKVPEFHSADKWVEALENFKSRTVKAAVPEEPKEKDENNNINKTNICLLNSADTSTNETVPGKTNPEFKHQDDADYWDFDKSEETETKTEDAVAVTKSDKENLPAEYVETPYSKVLGLIENFIKEYEDCSEIPTHSCDLYAEQGYNGIYFNSKFGHAPYHFRMMVENDPKVNTIYICIDPRKRHSVYKASTQRIGGDENGAYTCRLTFSTGSSYKRLLAPGDISGWDIHNKDISELLKEIKEIFETSEIECDAFSGKEYSI